MEIKKVTDPEFRKYGKIVEKIDFSGLIRALEEKRRFRKLLCMNLP
ncbi:hypothetical protein [Clostridium sp. OF09-36]